ncbi:hypothetical protein QKW35_13575 [Pontibacterium granulatum]|uniref:hypothetical protein n=1 Tax=Pontibacterium granulatum TaxID=2036029 RepID=UPI00249B78D3|nr:hypothetical protein [Pontibacterium granulatum]MDI3325407.1 hypothetical protein [Pontibacterium granulatum]
MEKDIWIQLLLPMELPEFPKRKKRGAKRKPRVIPVAVQLPLPFVLRELLCWRPGKRSLLKRAIAWVSGTVRKLLGLHVHD